MTGRETGGGAFPLPEVLMGLGGLAVAAGLGTGWARVPERGIDGLPGIDDAEGTLDDGLTWDDGPAHVTLGFELAVTE